MGALLIAGISTLVSGRARIFATPSRSPYWRWSDNSSTAALLDTIACPINQLSLSLSLLSLLMSDGRDGLAERATVLAVFHLSVVPMEHPLPAVHSALQIRPNTRNQTNVSSPHIPCTHTPSSNRTVRATHCCRSATIGLPTGLTYRALLCSRVSYHDTEVHFQWDILAWLAALGVGNGLLLRSAHGSWKTGVMPLMVAVYLLSATIGELLHARVLLHAIQQRMRKREASNADGKSKHVHHQ